MCTSSYRCRRACRFQVLTAFACAMALFASAWAVAAAPAGAAELREPQTVSQPTGEAADSSAPLKLKKIDEAGAKLGQGVDAFAGDVGAWLGNWVNATAFLSVTWFKLIMVMMLVFAVVVAERVVRVMIAVYQKKRAARRDPANIVDHVLAAADKPISVLVWVYGIYGALTPLFADFRLADGSNTVHRIFQRAADLSTAAALVWFAYRLVVAVDQRLKSWAEASDSSIDDMLAPLLGKTLRVFIIAIGAVFIIQNLTGLEIGPLLASLGVGGIAIALAAKESIANFFGTLTILFDKPFQVGQRVVIDGTDGTIEFVGFRSTRIRTLAGNQVTIPNEKLVSTSIENIGARPHIRWLTNITITYDTPAEKVEEAVAIIERILENHEGLHPDFPPRVYFNGFNDWSLNIMVVAWYHPANYWDMQAWLQRTCLQILRQFNAAGIDFAFPSQSLYLANYDSRQIILRMLKGEDAASQAAEKFHEGRQCEAASGERAEFMDHK